LSTDDAALLARIDALEAEVRSLRSSASATDPEESTGPVTRRRVLRVAGLAAAGAAGAIASPALTGRAAAGTVNGESVDLGEVNTATATTEIAGAVAAGPALTLTNTGQGAPLRLNENTDLNFDSIAPGDLFELDSVLVHTIDSGFAFPAIVHDTAFSNYLSLASPLRILDTRRSTPTADNLGRSLVTNAVGKFDPAGRLKAGQTIELRLDDFVFLATGLAGNFTVTGPLGAGYITVWNTSSPRPAASLVNFAAGQTIANWAIVPVGVDHADRDSISIFAAQTTHVILDRSGFVVSDPFVEDVGTPLAAFSPTPTETPRTWPRRRRDR
jgi:hypothetical protein